MNSTKINKNFKIKNKNLDKILLDKWINNSILEENAQQIITNKNDYSIMSYKIWLGVKNYMEITPDDNNKVINKITNIKNNIKIYSITIINKILLINKLIIITKFNNYIKNNYVLLKFFNI